MDITARSAVELHTMLVEKEIQAQELTAACLEKIRTDDQEIRAFLTVTAEQALKQAAAVDQKIAAGEKIGLLAGIPMALKDNISTLGIRTTCASKILESYIPPYDATVAEQLAQAGSVLLGKLNMDEFAMGSSTENSGFGKTCNPWNRKHVPGGSSGGAAAAVAGDEVVFSLGSDTGGSIRQPASFCGVVGLKPTYGAVSRYGLIAYASSLDQIGPVTRTVADNAHVFNAIAGHDAKDSTSIAFDKPDYSQFLQREIKGLKIGVPREYLAEGIDPEVKRVIREAIQTYTDLGALVEECSLPHTKYALAAYYLIATAECSSNLARYDGVRYGLRAAEAEDILGMVKQTRARGFGAEVKRRIMLGTYALSSGYYDAYYLKALKVRTLIKQDFDQAFAQADVLLAPTAPTTAWAFGAKADPLSMYLADICTIPVNLAGIPAISLPGGLAGGLPVGIQLMAKPLAEGVLFQAAHAFEQATAFHTLKPAPTGGAL
ncbi:MAG: Asp-tRNA(Asn)/Glu-tRNA(Gln) amidotransferase subunit GatA [Peptococcaceae bacterium]|nr:Asp-tRNA(Asn)/Glu-tRNA(Gln) amidotransferase subunit GatA [Peptococcaceae bacterium]